MSVLLGKRSIRYKVVQGHFYHLVLSFELSLATTAALLFEADLIDSAVLGKAANAGQSEFEKSSALLRKILMKIEVNQELYDTFLEVLHKVGITDLANELTAALKKEEASFLHPLQHSSPTRRSPRHSGRRSTYAERDSGVQEDSTSVTENEILPQHQKTFTKNSVKNREVSPVIIYSAPGNVSTSLVCNTSRKGVQTAIALSPIREHAPNDGAHSEAQATAIIKLNKRIKKLEADKVKGAEEVERMGNGIR